MPKERCSGARSRSVSSCGALACEGFQPHPLVTFVTNLERMSAAMVETGRQPDATFGIRQIGGNA